MSHNPHPARSPEFLSRLHDQDLSPAERAHFESHRAHCAECRTAAAEFEAALALFRSSTPRPASPDLAARILRKLQQNEIRSRRIRRFGPTFGIDLRWAGAFAAAVIAAIVGSSIVVRNEARERALRTLPVSLAEEPRAERPAPAGPGAASEINGYASDSASAPRRAQEGAKRETSLDALKAAPADAPRSPGVADERMARDKAGEADRKSQNAKADGDAAKKEGAGRVAAQDGAFGKQKNEPQKLASAEAHAYAPAPPAAARPAEKDREESAASSADRGQITGQVAMQSAPESRPAQENRPQSENERKRVARQQSPKPSAASNRNDSSMNQVQVDGVTVQASPAAPPPAAAPRDAERAGGEGGNISTESQNAAPLRLVVSPLDDAGVAPDLLPASATDLPNTLRGQEFVVVVDLGGRVRQVTPKRPELSDARRANDVRLKKLVPPSPLAVLRFQPGARQRRLLVRVE